MPVNELIPKVFSYCLGNFPQQ